MFWWPCRKLTLTGAWMIFRVLLLFVPKISEHFFMWYKGLGVKYPRWFDPMTVKCTKVIDGKIQMICHLRCRVQRTIFYDGVWEPLIDASFGAILQREDVFVDIGAHVGYHALRAWHRVGTEGAVVAFEPSPPTLELLIRNLIENNANNVLCYSCALGNSLQLGWLHQAPASQIGASSLRPLENYSKCAVPCLCFDDVVPTELKKRITAVKLDAEGWEMFVLQGMKELLSSPALPIVICEVIDPYLRHAGCSAWELVTYMSDLGYKAFFAPNEAGKNEKWRPLAHDESATREQHQDILFLHSSQAHLLIERLVAHDLMVLPEPEPADVKINDRL